MRTQSRAGIEAVRFTQILDNLGTRSLTKLLRRVLSLGETPSFNHITNFAYPHRKTRFFSKDTYAAILFDEDRSGRTCVSTRKIDALLRYTALCYSM